MGASAFGSFLRIGLIFVSARSEVSPLVCEVLGLWAVDSALYSGYLPARAAWARSKAVPGGRPPTQELHRARLPSARAYGSEGWGFESLRAHLRARAENIPAVQCDEVREPAWSSPLMFGCRGRVAAPDRVPTAQHRRGFRVNGRMPRMTCTAVTVQQAVDGTPGGVFNRPF
jgi:hypothetical protein